MKPLLDLDSNYKEKLGKLTVEERIKYCNSLVDRYQLSLEKGKAHMGDELKMQFKELIMAAQKEIERIQQGV